MSRSEILFLLDAEEACQKILRYTQDMDFETFIGTEMAYDAVLRNLEIIGVAVKGVSQELRNRYPELDWRSMAGLRDVLAHAYFALDDQTLWSIVENDIPQVLPQIARILVENQEGDSDQPLTRLA